MYLLLKFGFHPVAVIGKRVQKYETESNAQQEKYKNTEYTKQKTNIQNKKKHKKEYSKIKVK
jgi:hypothetical protein